MARKGGSDRGAVTARRAKVELQSSGFSTATQSTIDAGASKTKSFSEGTITRNQKEAEASTISSDGNGIQLAHQSSLRRVVSLEPASPLNKEIIAGNVEQEQLVHDIFKLTSKAPYTDKHLMSESSSSNSSHVIAPNQPENKRQFDPSVETKPDREEMATVKPASLKKDKFLKGTVKQLKPCDEHATCETSQLSEQLCSVKTKQAESVCPETRHGSKEAAHAEQQLRVNGFDLNEDFESNEVGNTENVSEPIAVVARVGVPNGLPSIPLRFDGELGWRRSVATSAFRPTFPSNNSDLNKGPSPRGFDLNIAPPSETHAVELGLKVSERLTSNHNSEGDEYNARPNSRMLNFDLNDNLLMDKDTSGGSHQPKRHYPPIDHAMNGSARQGNVSSGVRPAYWVDLSSMQGFTHVQGQQFIVAAPTLFPSADQKRTLVPLQPNMAAFAPGPPPSGYYLGTTNGLSSSIYSPNMLPHFGSQHGISTTLPQIAYPGSLRLMEAGEGLNPGGYNTNMRPNFYLNGGVGSSENLNTPAEERMRLPHTVVLPSALSDKRKEPEGSWGSFQHNHRRMTTWK